MCAYMYMCMHMYACMYACVCPVIGGVREACEWHGNTDSEDGEPRLPDCMGRCEDWLEEEARLAKECDYQSPSEADEDLRARYENNKREVDQAEFEAYEEALEVEAGPIQIMCAGRRGSMRVRGLVRDPDLRAGANAGCRGSLGIMGSMAEALRAGRGSHQGAEGEPPGSQRAGR